MSGAVVVAGRGLDAVVAEKVMGWTNVGCESNAMHTEFTPHGKPPFPVKNFSGRLELPRYSTDIAAALTVVEELRDRFHVALQDYGDVWQAEFVAYKRVEGRREYSILLQPLGAEAETPALAICLAALEATGTPESTE